PSWPVPGQVSNNKTQHSSDHVPLFQRNGTPKPAQNPKNIEGHKPNSKTDTFFFKKKPNPPKGF
ncbi:MAG: hypothetical protein D6714_09405, partial [Bacteroidetes bacterium]